jgi:small subunit ribosomal protein S19e
VLAVKSHFRNGLDAIGDKNTPMEWQQKVMEQIILLAFADRFLSVIAIIGPLEKMAKQATVKDVAPAKFIAAYAAHLKKGGKITLPAWVDIVKTSSNNELAPSDSEWYYVRAAAVARKIYVKGGVGVGSMRRLFGRASRTGPTPVHTGSSSGAVIRSVLKNLEKLGLVEKDPNGGRRITSTGQRDLDLIATSIVSK